MKRPLKSTFPATTAQHGEQVVVTALPNGRTSDKGLKLSLLFTLSLPKDRGICHTWFENWNSDDSPTAGNIGSALRNGEWTFTFSDVSGRPLDSPRKKPQVYRRIPEMWALLFKGRSGQANSNRKAARIKTPWHIAHDAAFMDYVLKRHRRARSVNRYAERRQANTFSDEARTTLDGQFACIDVYLHPNLGDTTTNPPIKDQLKARADLLDPSNANWIPTAVRGLVSSENRDFLTERFQYGISVLDSEDQPLAPLGILALWRHCALSLSFDPNKPIAPVLSAIENMASGLNYRCDSLSQAQRIVEFLLVSRNKDTGTGTNDCSATMPDFHQMLGMVNRYPALLRPLGLAVDVTLSLPAQADKAVLLTVAPPITDSSIVCCRTAIYIGPAGEAGEAEFCARSQYDRLLPTTPKTEIDDGYRLLQARYLWLGATSKDDGHSSLFYTTSEDATGSMHKIVNSSFSYRRGSQYRQYMTQRHAKRAAPDTLPSARTTGIQLFHVARAARSQKLSEKPINLDPPPILYADNLILGYRVDMTDGRKDGRWFSLGARLSSYKSLDGSITWQPSTDEDLMADEGFVTLGGIVEDGGSSTVIRMDQALWTWYGENLSVPPFFSRFSRGQKSSDNAIFPLIPTYSVADHSELPQRFETTYRLRSRVVDLCGNSPKLGKCVPRNEHSNDVVTLSHCFLREEPFRGPQLLLREPIDRTNRPGDNITTLVLRDGSGFIERAVVPPRETRQLAEWSGKLDRGLPRGAFEQFWLDDKGRFVTVQDEANGGPDNCREVDPEQQDGLLCLGPSRPRHRYFPDPHVLFACIQFKPPGDFTPWTNSEAQYLAFYAQDAKWPNANPVVLRLLPTEERAHTEMREMTLFPPTTFANTPGITFYLPKATDAIVELSSAGCTASNPSQHPVRLAIRQTPERAPASSQDNHRKASSVSTNRGATWKRPSLVSTNSTTSKTKPEIPESVILNAVGLGDRTELGRHTDDLLASNGSWTDGRHPTVSPPHQIRLVHAVRRPLGQPIVKDLTLTRQYGDTNACISGSLDPCVRSTGKITFHASYELYIDDPARPQPECVHYNETAFEVELPYTPVDPSKGLPNYFNGKQHIFRDNRARSITYSTVATSKFLGFYPDVQDHQSQFELKQTLSGPVEVKATVRPPAPVIAYIIPAFRWDETYNNGKVQKSRVCHLRVYMERPFPVTDNDQMLGVVLAPSKTTTSSSVGLFVSKIGMDPTQGSWAQHGVTKEAMDAKMFTNSAQTGAGFLAESTPAFAMNASETGAVDILGFQTHFVKSRNLWFADIRIQPTETSGDDAFLARSPFVQLALTRYAPNGLVGISPLCDARMSPVVLADFVQLAEDRCCTLSRNGKSITVCVSGPFVAVTNPVTQQWDRSRMRWEWTRETRISVELQHRWHSVDEEVSWLPVKPVFSDSQPFKFEADDLHGMGTLTIRLDLPHSPAWFKYAVLVMEEEILSAKDSATAKVYRTRYFDQIEI